VFDLLFQRKRGDVEKSVIEKLLGGMPSWTEEGNCKGADADIFFPERGASTRKAKSICRACSVQEDCLEFAIENSEKFGIWGGLSERERRRIKRQRIDDNEIREVG
jgi:WhiB family redox-sensing transcriptional regulator